jgi:hypothetical protein
VGGWARQARSEAAAVERLSKRERERESESRPRPIAGPNVR